MLTHLKAKHPSETIKTPEKTPSIAAFASTRTRRPYGAQSEMVHNAMAKMVVKDFLPLRIVEGKI
jgi:hypothetical protein